MNRRRFLTNSAKLFTGFGALPILPRLLSSQAMAQTSGGYKAIVCLLLDGGNDGNNMLVPADRFYSDYVAGRGPLALSRNSLNLMSPASSGRVFGAHPSLKNVAALHNAGHAAWLANAGPLTIPTTKQSLAQGTSVPAQLFAHPDQQNEWESANTQSTSTSGWAGRIADLMSSRTTSTSQAPMVISTSGWSLFGAGRNTTPASIGVGLNQASVLTGLENFLPSLQAMETGDPANHLHAEISAMQSNILTTTSTLQGAYQAGSSLKTVFPTTSIGQQLQSIAYLINARNQLDATTQIFFCKDSGYDTHSDQLGQHATSLAGVDAAIGSFVSSMQEIGLFNQVTLFTMSDFARSLQPNGTGGADHAWGNHHLIIGGAVKGGDVYGTFPSLALGGDDDASTTGLWIPTTSGSQYAATLSHWLGVGTADNAIIFPELANFTTSTLGFL